MFVIALANQEQHTDLGAYENRNKRDTCFEWPWRYENDQYAFGVALANQEQRIVFDWPWWKKNTQSMFGVALTNQNVCTRKCIQMRTLTAQVRGETVGQAGKRLMCVIT